MDKRIRKYCSRFVRERFPDEAKVINSRAEAVYQKLSGEAPDIGGRRNIMAGNLYQFLTFLAYYEATDRRITKEDIRTVVGWMLDDMRFIGRVIDMNKRGWWRIFYGIMRPYAAKVQRMKAKGRWGNTWTLLVNPEKHDSGFSIHLVGCPLYDFAKAHGYMDILPMMCQIDHDIAALMHARLIREHTIAMGGECCDYWYVGDESLSMKTDS